MMVAAAPHHQELDAHLNSMIQVLKDAVDQAMRRADSDPTAVDATLQDCEEILDHVMAGDVESWLRETD